MESTDKGLNDRLAKLKRDYLVQLPAKIDEIEKAWVGLISGPLEGKTCARLVSMAHVLNGSSFALGFHGIGIQARALENLFKSIDTEAGLSQQIVNHIDEALSRLKEKVNDISDSPAQIKEAAVESVERPILESQSQSRHGCHKIEGTGRDLPLKCDMMLYLCYEDATDKECIYHALRENSFDIMEFGSFSSMMKGLNSIIPAAIIIDTALCGDNMEETFKLYFPRLEKPHMIPFIYISDDGSLDNRLRCVRSGGDAFFLKPVNTGSLFQKIQELTTEIKNEPYRIVIIEDQLNVAEYYASILQLKGMETRVITNPLDVFGTLREFNPDLILMDVYMPDCSGNEVAKVIRQIDDYVSVPIVFLSAESDKAKQLNVMHSGGDDFLCKSSDPDHIVISVKLRAERMRMIRSYNELKDYSNLLEQRVEQRTLELQQSNERLKELNRELETMATTDTLTGIFNRLKFNAILETEVQRYIRYAHNLSIILFDLDLFKNVNDEYGHDVGDLVLIAIARLVKETIRTSDVFARWGGEEFIILLPETTLKQACLVAEKVRQTIESNEFEEVKGVTCSFGVSQFRSGDVIKDFFKRCDDALYEAKKHGRNKVFPCAYEQNDTTDTK